MGILVKNKNVTAIQYGSRIITAVYKGAKLIWTAVSSCFGSGVWIGEKPWSDTEVWKD